ncbi:MAG: hypothetical protein IT446_10710 [Phycisphaerales bacterium]|nr:hypothetical protein [Phycisphaerales bacterium]
MQPILPTQPSGGAGPVFFHRQPPPHRGVRVGICIVLATVFTLMQIHYSMRHGRLLYAPGYDDVGYFNDGLIRLKQFYDQSVQGLVRDYVHSPPHTPFSTFLAMGAFAVFGRHEWAPYAANGLIILGLLLFVDFLLRGTTLLQRILVYLSVLTLPYCAAAVSEFRPDIACGLLTAAGIVLLLRQPLWSGSNRHKVFAGLIFGAAILVKPAIFPVTVALLGLSLLLATICDWISFPRARRIETTSKSWMLVILPALAVMLPHFLLAGKYIIQYIQTAVSGRDKALWALKGDTQWQLVYYLTGKGGHDMLSSLLWLVAAIWLVGAILMLVEMNRPRVLRGVAFFVVTAAAYFIPAVNHMKSPFLAAAFYGLLLLGMVIVLRDLGTWFGIGRLGRPAGTVLLAVVLGVSAWLAKFPDSLGDPASPQTISRNRTLNEVYAALHQSAAKRISTRTFVTTAGELNAETLQFLALRDALPMNFADQHRSDDLNLYRQELDRSDYCIASEAGVDGIIDWLPSTRIQDQTLELVRTYGGFRQIAEVPTINGRRYFIFEKPGSFSGWDRIDGLAGEEGPYPQWQLPVVRWGLGNATTARFTADAGGVTLRIVARADIAGQVMTVELDGKPLMKHSFDQSGRFDTLDIPLPVTAGVHSVVLRYLKHDLNPDRPMAVLFQKLQITIAH